MSRFRYSYFPKGWPRGVPPPLRTSGASNSNKATKPKNAKKRVPKTKINDHAGQEDDGHVPGVVPLTRDDSVAGLVSASPADPSAQTYACMASSVAATPGDPIDNTIDEAVEEEEPTKIDEAVHGDSSSDEDSSEEDKAVFQHRVVTQSEYQPSPSCHCHGTQLRHARCAGCDCVLAGRLCTPSCRCGDVDKLGHTGGCGNPFDADVRDAFFGRATDEFPAEAWARGAEPVLFSHCFAEWLIRKRLLGGLTHSHVLPALLSGAGIPKEPAGGSNLLGKEMRVWLARWKVANDTCGEQCDGKELLRLTQELMRGALGLGRNFFGWYYSFCKGEWVAGMWHCHRCRICVPWDSWHCGRCRKCVAGLLLPCDRCGGVSDDHGRQAQESKERYLAYRYEGVPL